MGILYLSSEKQAITMAQWVKVLAVKMADLSLILGIDKMEQGN